MNAALYIRVSTEEQAKEGYSINAQKQRLQDFAKSQGWDIYKEYIDEGYSAKNLERPQMQKMIKDIKKRQFDVILVYRLDRLVRSVMDLHELLQLFDQHNVMFKSSTEAFDTTSAMGRFFITLVGAMAAWERENLAERVHMGMKRMTEEGKRPGAMAPFGYDLVDGKLVINPEQAKWVKYIFENYRTKGTRMIAINLNELGILTRKKSLWRENIVKYTLSNPIYCGMIRWNHRKLTGEKTNDDIIVDGDHEAIISKKLFDEVQEIMNSRSKGSFKGHTHYPFTGVLKCARCGNPMIGAQRKKKKGYHRFYRCIGRAKFKTCDLPVVPEHVIEDEFFNNQLEIKSKDIEIDSDIDYEVLERELSKIKTAASKLKKLFMWEDITEMEYRSEVESLNQREKEIQSQLNNRQNEVNIDDVKAVISDIKTNWSYYTYEQRKSIIGTIIHEITLDVTKAVVGGHYQKPEIKLINVTVK